MLTEKRRVKNYAIFGGFIAGYRIRREFEDGSFQWFWVSLDEWGNGYPRRYRTLKACHEAIERDKKGLPEDPVLNERGEQAPVEIVT